MVLAAMLLGASASARPIPFDELWLRDSSTEVWMSEPSARYAKLVHKLIDRNSDGYDVLVVEVEDHGGRAAVARLDRERRAASCEGPQDLCERWPREVLEGIFQGLAETHPETSVTGRKRLESLRYSVLHAKGLRRIGVERRADRVQESYHLPYIYSWLLHMMKEDEEEEATWPARLQIVREARPSELHATFYLDFAQRRGIVPCVHLVTRAVSGAVAVHNRDLLQELKYALQLLEVNAHAPHVHEGCACGATAPFAAARALRYAPQRTKNPRLNPLPRPAVPEEQRRAPGRKASKVGAVPLRYEGPGTKRRSGSP